MPDDDRGARLLTGWGRTAATAARVVRPDAEDAVAALLTAPGRAVLPRGLGRSYGDAAQSAGGTVVDTTGLTGIDTAGLAGGRVSVGAGTSLGALLRTVMPCGWFPAVTPGTRFVTVGGAIAADVHGKNHHCDGTFGAHVESLRLRTPAGPATLGPDRDPEAFWATIGGMGLTGVVTRATLRLLPIGSELVRIDTERAADLDDLLARMGTGDDRYRYSVAWVDCMARGARAGRGVLTRADHAAAEELPPAGRTRPRWSPPVRAAFPRSVPVSLARPASIRAFNELWYRKAPASERGRLVGLHGFFYPLDTLEGWNHLYGPRGFVQYQFAVPFGAEDTLRTALARLSAAGCPVALAVLKRFGEANPALLSFPIAGWTLALDLPVGPAGLARTLDDIDGLVAAVGGRVYLAKDARLRPDALAAMYPRLAEWRAVRDRLDPGRVLRSDLDRRLGLVGEAA